VRGHQSLKKRVRIVKGGVSAIEQAGLSIWREIPESRPRTDGLSQNRKAVSSSYGGAKGSTDHLTASVWQLRSS
jgi:hypothetical protein